MVLREWLSSRNGGILTAITAFLVLTYVNLSIHQQYREHVLNQVRYQVHPLTDNNALCLLKSGAHK